MQLGADTGRFPHGKRGLKLIWPLLLAIRSQGRFPHGKRGLKLPRNIIIKNITCRFPHGKRGLKYPEKAAKITMNASLPPREAWIEILKSKKGSNNGGVASPTGSVD